MSIRRNLPVPPRFSRNTPRRGLPAFVRPYLLLIFGSAILLSFVVMSSEVTGGRNGAVETAHLQDAVADKAPDASSDGPPQQQPVKQPVQAPQWEVQLEASPHAHAHAHANGDPGANIYTSSNCHKCTPTNA